MRKLRGKVIGGLSHYGLTQSGCYVSIWRRRVEEEGATLPHTDPNPFFLLVLGFL